MSEEHPLFLHIKNNDFCAFRKYLQQFGVPMIRNERGESLLIVAVRENALKSIRLLAVNKEVLEAIDFKGNTPLMVACKLGFTDAVKCLIDAKADIDAQNVFGKTALMYAAFILNSEIVELLATHGANTGLVDTAGNSAYTYLKKHPSPLLNDLSTKRKIKNALGSHTDDTQRPVKKARVNSFLELLGKKQSPNAIRRVFWTIVVLVAFVLIPAAPSLTDSRVIFLLLVACCAFTADYFRYTIDVMRYVPAHDEKEIKTSFSQANLSLAFLSTLFNFGFKDLKLSCQDLVCNKIQSQARRMLLFPISVLVISLLLVVSIVLNVQENLVYTLLLLVCLSFILGIILEFIRRRFALKNMYKLLDEEAETFMQIALAKINQPHSIQSTALYLRAFETTGQLMVRNVDLELAISRFLSPVMLLVTFGLPC